MNAKAVLVRVLGIVGLLMPFGMFALVIWLVWTSGPSTPAEQAAEAERQAKVKEQNAKLEEQKDFLCRAAAACKKYSEARSQCAVAGNFKTCLRLKMGDDASYSGMCSGYEDGAAAVPLPPETPNAVDCFFRNLSH